MSYLEDYINHVSEFKFASQSPLVYALYSNADDRSKYMIDDVMSRVPYLGAVYSSVFTQRQLYDYMRNNPNVDWSDALRYHKFSTSAGAIASAGYSFVSRNIDKLYNDEKSEKYNARIQRDVRARLRQYYGIW